MDQSLNTYIKRASNITNNNCNSENEFMLMITYLENTLLFIKYKYEQTHTTVNKIEKTSILKNVNNMSLYEQSANQINLNKINELDQYSIKINNLVLRGNLATIYDRKLLHNDKVMAHQVVQCINKNKCKNILKQTYCKYFHDPLDLFELKTAKLISDEFYNLTINFTRNFSNTSWIYSPNSKNPNLRLIGSKNSLLNDIKLIKLSKSYKDNVEIMKQQVMHDLLILLVLSEYNLA